MRGMTTARRPVVLMADTILKTPALKEKYGRKAEKFYLCTNFISVFVLALLPDPKAER